MKDKLLLGIKKRKGIRISPVTLRCAGLFSFGSGHRATFDIEVSGRVESIWIWIIFFVVQD
jgi:hypothetical protein